jgi:predicted DsbA family dithiol-disulfide isomerase
MWGVVRDANTGAPIGGASVTYTDSKGQTGTATTDANGMYAFDQGQGQGQGQAPAAGPVNFAVDAPGYEPLTETRQVLYDDIPAGFREVQSFSLGRQDGQYPNNPSQGPSNAPVTIVEFSDFQCPYCARFAQQTLPLILSDYSDNVHFVFVNFPLTQIHQFAQKAAEAGECANAQGAFWQYHDLLFQNQGALDVNSLKGYAAHLGLNTAEFNDCLDSEEMASAVQADIEAGQEALQEAGVTSIGVPSFLINGKPVMGAQPYDVFKQAIDAALAGPNP